MHRNNYVFLVSSPTFRQHPHFCLLIANGSLRVNKKKLHAFVGIFLWCGLCKQDAHSSGATVSSIWGRQTGVFDQTSRFRSSHALLKIDCFYTSTVSKTDLLAGTSSYATRNHSLAGLSGRPFRGFVSSLLQVCLAPYHGDMFAKLWQIDWRWVGAPPVNAAATS